MAKNNSDLVGTLSIGNVITTGTTLYKSNFKRYFQVSLRATGWGIAMVLAAVVAVVLGGILFGLTNQWLVTIPVILGWIGVTSYFLAKYNTNRAVICRLAYQDLIDAPETVQVATQQLKPRTWAFLGLSLLLGLYLSLVSIISSIILSIGLFAVVGLLIYGLKLSADTFWVGLSIGLFTIGLFLVWIAILIRYYAYWFVAELPLAIESNVSANFSIGRSKRLTTAAANRVVLIITVAFLMTIPINLVGNMPSFIGQIMASPAVSTDPTAQIIGGGLILIGFILNLLGEIFVMPFWQAMKAIIYYDLRNRREGGDLII
jgi:hypothetical protein